MAGEEARQRPEGAGMEARATDFREGGRPPVARLRPAGAYSRTSCRRAPRPVPTPRNVDRPARWGEKVNAVYHRLVQR
jgi:hypothetical protein